MKDALGMDSLRDGYPSGCSPLRASIGLQDREARALFSTLPHPPPAFLSLPPSLSVLKALNAPRATGAQCASSAGPNTS